MKKTILTIIFAFILINVKAQAPNWAWAKGVGSDGVEQAWSTTTDASGNVYLTGSFSSDSITLGTTVLTNADSTGNTVDLFVIKCDASGNILWAKGAGGLGDEYGTSITIDASDNVYVTGYYTSSTITFGTTILNNASLYSYEGDMFIAKYDALGNVIWAKGLSGQGGEAGLDITTDNFGNVFITGQFNSPSVSLGTTTLTNSGSGYDIFVIKCDSSGNVLWAKSEGNVGWDRGHGIETDITGNVYVTGSFSSSSITIGTYTITNGGYYNMLVIKYDSLGNVLWAKGAGITLKNIGYKIVSDDFGNIFVVGIYNSPSITFDTFTLTNSNTSGLTTNMFVVKYDSLGNILWANTATGVVEENQVDVTADATGNIYVTGSFLSPTIIFGTSTVNNFGAYDMFIVKYDTSGNVLWAKGAGSTENDLGQSVTTDTYGNIYVAGFGGPMTFGTNTITNEGSWDIFIAKLDANIVDIENNTFTQGISIYPNPSNSICTIKSTDLKLQNYSVYNVLGESVFSQNSNLTNQINIDLSAQAKGIYFVETTDENWNVSNTKIIIQ